MKRLRAFPRSQARRHAQASMSSDDYLRMYVDQIIDKIDEVIDAVNEIYEELEKLS